MAEELNEEEDYRERVRSAIAAMRRKAGMTQDEYALALSEELARTIRANKVTQWERGTFLPKSDIFLASMAISGADSRDLGINPRAMTAIRVNQLQRQVREMQAQRKGRAVRLPHRLDLEPASGPTTDYVSTTQAAALIGVPRSQMYDFRQRGVIAAYRLGTRTVFLRSEVEALVKARLRKT